jgi:CRISPR-associated protein Csx17
MNTIPLEGCTPEPLMNYLKALGLLKIIVEQNFDSSARGYWKDGVFCLRTSISEEELIEAFVNGYQPSPILSPWNGEAGFLAETGSGVDAIAKLKSSTSDRLKPLRGAISDIQSIDLLASLTRLRSLEKSLKKKKKATKLTDQEVNDLKLTTYQIKELKQHTIYQLRAQLPEMSLAWLDACMVVGQDGFKPAPYLGSGGVDGRMEFSVNYISNVMLVLEDKRSVAWIKAAFSGRNEERNISTSIGQFAPGRIGGANGTQGTEGSSMINPWDYVLMIEGSLFLAGSTSRKLGTSGGSKSTFPFTMNPAPVGMETLTESDGALAKGELWLPLWERPSSIGELKQLFSEGRADLNGRQARDGVDFSRAIANLGVDRGIKSFSRQGFLQRNGLSFIATPLGNFDVEAKNDASLLREIDPWLAAMKRSCTDKAPSRFRSALREIERGIFDYCQHGETGGNRSRFQRILIGLGNAERMVAKAPKFRAEAKGLRPLGPLSSQWIGAADDRSPEFEIALALASLGHPDIGGIRLNLEDVEIRGRQVIWTERNHAAVWNESDLTANLAAVLYRRVMDADKVGNSSAALFSKHRVTLTSIGEFLAGNLDDTRITELLWALSLCETRTYQRPAGNQDSGDRLILPATYRLLKLLFHTPGSSSMSVEENAIKPNLGILSLLRADRTPEACQRTVRLLRGKSLIAMPFAMRGFPSRDGEWLDHACSDCSSEALAAALLIPISDFGLNALRNQVLRPQANS